MNNLEGGNMNTLDLFRNEDKTEHYATGKTIFEQGQPGNKMYIIKEGNVDINVGDQTVLSIGPGELLGEMALIDTSARSATAVASSDCQLIPIDERRFTYLVQQTPFFSIHVMRILVERLRKMNKIVNV